MCVVHPAPFACTQHVCKTRLSPVLTSIAFAVLSYIYDGMCVCVHTPDVYIGSAGGSDLCRNLYIHRVYNEMKTFIVHRSSLLCMPIYVYMRNNLLQVLFNSNFSWNNIFREASSDDIGMPHIELFRYVLFFFLFILHLRNVPSFSLFPATVLCAYV